MQTYKTETDRGQDGQQQYETPRIHTGPDDRYYLILKTSLADTPREGTHLTRL